MKPSIDIVYIGETIARNTTLHGWVGRQLRLRGWRLQSQSYLESWNEDLGRLSSLMETPQALLILTDPESYEALKHRLPPRSDTVTLLPLTEGTYPESLPLPEHPHRRWQLFFPASFQAELLGKLREATDEVFTLRPLLPGWIELELQGLSLPPVLKRTLDHPQISKIPRSSLVAALIEYFSSVGKTLTFAESCTGGRLAAAITAESGSSAIFEGSFVTYANRIKSEWLGVAEATLKDHGAVSEACVREMARGAQAKAGAGIAVAISGIAGPTGAVPGKPVGTVYLCLRNGEKEEVKRVRLSGDRNAVQEQAVLHALKMVVESEENIFDFFSENS
ncbi:CinA family protein [Nitratifractor sp.]